MTAEPLPNLKSLWWEIQRKRKSYRSRALVAAPTPFLAEDITHYDQVKRRSQARPPHKAQPQESTLFQ